MVQCFNGRHGVEKSGIVCQCLHGCVECKLGTVVVVADVAKPHFFQVRAVAADDFSCFGIGQMAPRAADARPEVVGVRTVLQHVGVVVGLKHQVLCLAYVLLYLWGDVSGIGKDAPCACAQADMISHTVHAVMGYGKGFHREAAYGIGLARLNGPSVFLRWLPSNDAIGQDALPHGLGCVDRYAEFFGKLSGCTGMVNVVVRNEDCPNVLGTDAVKPKVLQNFPYANSRVNEDSSTRMPQIVCIAAAAAAQAEKL